MKQSIHGYLLSTKKLFIKKNTLIIAKMIVLINRIVFTIEFMKKLYLQKRYIVCFNKSLGFI